jgi:hypothetical protein
MFFHTIIGNSPIRAPARRNLVYVDATWTIRGDHRYRLTDAQLKFFESREKVRVEDEWDPREVLFARKFSDDSLDLLQRIDNMIERKENDRTSP